MSRSPFARVSVVDQVESTNTMLREAATAAPAAWPHLSVLVAEHQTAGRGRSGRSWSTPRGSALTASILVRPDVPPHRLPWLTLLTGLAVVRALDSPRIGLKWPNDLLVVDAGPHLSGWGTARKVGGILTEALPAPQPTAVIGLGLNLTQTAADLPVPTATSLAAAGLPAPSRDDLLTAVGQQLARMLPRWEAADGDAAAAGLLAELSAACLTLGSPVRVDRPAGDPLIGTATAIDSDGQLIVTDANNQQHAVVAGDVWHVRDNGPGASGAVGANLSQ
ncbi:MAG TPA: biotin--[acetyl-CoA-carboxylase] ligase [Actinomycetaceae bacterium]|nr:biotin--[acetyl-CoA-carboxylase] ligase [Actinomycetaceae bacterium]